MMTSKRIFAGLGILLALMALAGCAHAQAQSSPASRLLGKWYDSQSGGVYDFINDSLLIVPHAQAGGGNAVAYRILDSDKLDIVADNTHHVSLIGSITADKLTLQDPVSGSKQYFFRNISATAHLRSLEASALAAASGFATITVNPVIEWVAPMPTGKTAEWTAWSPTTLGSYSTAWDWTTLKRDKYATLTSGGGDGMGYSFSFWRRVPLAKDLAKIKADTSLDATAGLQHIDVGYSASKAQYAAGTMVYLPGGMIYSLGDGFAIAVEPDRNTRSFVPVTHK